MREGSFASRISGQMRGTDDPIWQVAGKKNAGQANPWQTNITPYANTTANAFWMLYRGVGPSWVVANPTLLYPTWDHYYAQAAVRTKARSAVGMLVAYQDCHNYLLFRWTARDAAQPGAMLIAMVNRQPTMLATSPRGCDPGQWYTLRVNLGWRQVQVLVDGQELLTAGNPGPVEGRVGLYADLAAEVTSTAVVSTDPAAEGTEQIVTEAIRDTEAVNAIYFADVQVGEWNGATDVCTGSSLNQDRTGRWAIHHGLAQAVSTGHLMTGRQDWNAYVLDAQVQLPPCGQAGILIWFSKPDKPATFGCSCRRSPSIAPLCSPLLAIARDDGLSFRYNDYHLC